MGRNREWGDPSLASWSWALLECVSLLERPCSQCALLLSCALLAKVLPSDTRQPHGEPTHFAGQDVEALSKHVVLHPLARQHVTEQRARVRVPLSYLAPECLAPPECRAET